MSLAVGPARGASTRCARPADARRRRAATALWALLCAWLLTAWPLPGQAHAMPESRVWVDSRPGGLRLTLLMPLNRLEFAFGQPLIDDPAAVLPRHAQALSAYVQRHVAAHSAGLAWQTLAPSALRVIGSDGQADLEVVLDLLAPPGADARQATLRYDAVTHEVKTHRVQFFLRNDWHGGFVGQAPRPLGQLDAQHTQLDLRLGPPAQAGSAAALGALLADGLQHIARGPDHLLFLLLLLLVAPLTAAGRRWQGQRPVAQTLGRLAWLVSAFTLGHTLTLAVGSVASLGPAGLPLPPARAVEMAVAASIVLTALHAWRPLWPGAEPAMALAFGLVHGFAFSASLSGAGLDTGQHALALLAFNLGIEAGQVLLLALALPPLLALSRHSPQASHGLRLGLAGAGLAMGLLWLAARSGLARFSALAAWPLLQ